MKFRSDINGLRAIAVIAVVLYHFDKSLIPGGFAGVDVFFVISGFLMTGIIINGIQEDNFKLGGFYYSRAKRILPPLFFLCLTLLIYGAFSFTPIDYEKITQHISSSLLFLSNFVYWNESGYFDAASNEKWLLHTWSLSAEWQFYMLYPILLMMLGKCVERSRIKFYLLCITLFAFGYSVISTYYFPNASYFLLPSRAWEMLIGGVAFLFPWQTKEIYKKAAQWLGFSMIIATYFLISNKIPWPGFMAFIPVVGTYLIIISNRESSRLTNNVVFQHLGKWSYSIYLWHWPIVVYGYLSETPEWLYVGIPLSILLGYLSFTFIESYKNRNGINIFSKHCIALAMVILIMTGIQFLRTNNYIKENPERIDGYLIGYNYSDESGKLVLNNIEETTIFNPDKKQKLLMLGDSNSAHYSYGIALSGKLQIHHRWEGSCFPFINANTKPYAAWMDEDWKENCHHLYQFIDEHKDVPIIVSNQWGERDMACTGKACNGFDEKKFDTILTEELNTLIAYVGNRKIFFIGQVPAPLKSMVKCMKQRDKSECERNTNKFTGNRHHMNSLLESIAKKHKNVFFINPFDAVCDEENRCNTVINDKNLFFDAGHLSAFGSKVIWQHIEKQILNEISVKH